MSTRWTLHICVVFVIVCGLNTVQAKKKAKTKKLHTVQAECHCRDGCLAEGDCKNEGRRGCFVGWGAARCDNKTFQTADCKYLKKNNTLSCKKVCTKGNLDGLYCSRENVAFKNRGKVTLQDGITNTDCVQIPHNGNKRQDINLKNGLQSALIEIFVDSGNLSANCQVQGEPGNHSCASLNQRISRSLLYKCEKADNITKVIVNCERGEPTVCLSEVKVYKCRDYWFGPETECAFHCNCQGGVLCDPWTGECPENSGCAKGFFGKNCVSQCHSCVDNKRCRNKSNGACKNQTVLSSPSTSSRPETPTSSSSSASPSTSDSTYSIPATPSTVSTQIVTDTSTAVAPFISTRDTDSVFSPTLTTLSQTSTLAVGASRWMSSKDSLIVTHSASTAVSEISTLGVADSASSVTEDSSTPTTVLTTSIKSTIPEVSDKSSTDTVVSGDLFTVESLDSNAEGTAGVTDATLSSEAPSVSLVLTGLVFLNARAVVTDPESSVATTTHSLTETYKGSGDSVSTITSTFISNTSIGPDLTTSEKSGVENTGGTLTPHSSDVTVSISTPHSSDETTTERTSTNTTLTTLLTTTHTSFIPETSTTLGSPTSTITPSSSTPQTISRSMTVSTTAPPARQTAQSSSTTSAAPTSIPKRDSKNDSGNEYTVAGVLFGLAACVLVAMIAFVFIYRRSMRRKMNTSCEQPIVRENPWDNDHSGAQAVTMSDLLQNESLEDTAVYAICGPKFEPTVTPITVGNFRNHIGYLESTEGYAKEFQALPKDLLGSLDAATKSFDADVRRNRFKDICPYDDTRVVLTKQDSDYINASYIDGFAETRAYIAAQGPLPDTMGDFWHMVWTEGCGKIVMLTNLQETGKVKCEQYWPNEENSTTTFGHYTVTLIDVTTHAFFVQRNLRVVKNTSENDDGERQRHIHHFHFTAWPDHSVPLAAPMVEFWEQVKHVPSRLSGPLLVHCSAGVGRTGTFIGLDILIRQAETTGSVSVFPTVKRMRQQRVKMVQTQSQYMFLHEALDEWLSSRDTVVSLHDLQNDPAWLNERGQLSDTVHAKIAAHFQLLDQLRPRPSKKLTHTALLPENASKNRMSHILPMEQCRVCLWSPEEEDSDYINAVFLPSMSTQLGFIVTQLPLRDTLADFWHMVYDWKAKVVIRFLSTPEQESHMALCPEEGCRIKFGPVTVGNDSVSPWKPGITKSTIQLQNEAVEDHTQTVKVYSVDHDMTSSLTDTSPFLMLADHLLPLVGSLPQPPVVVQCFDGVALSCMLCAVVTALQTLQVERRVSPYTLARTLQTCRPQAFSMLEQYECMVRCLLDYARGGETAGNTVNPTDAANGDEGTSPQDAIYANV